MLKQQVGILPHIRFDGIVLRRGAARHTPSLIYAGLRAASDNFALTIAVAVYGLGSISANGSSTNTM